MLDVVKPTKMLRILKTYDNHIEHKFPQDLKP